MAKQNQQASSCNSISLPSLLIGHRFDSLFDFLVTFLMGVLPSAKTEPSAASEGS